MILPVFILFAILSFLFLTERSCNNKNGLLIVCVYLTMVFISTFRPIEMPDTMNYIHDLDVCEGRFEVGYKIIRNIVKYVGGNYLMLFLCVSALSIAIKFKVLSKSTYMYGGILVYLSYFFVLHDMIQIRAGIASGIILIAIKQITDNNLGKFLFFSFLAVCFHYSALIILPFWFIRNITIKKSIWILVIPVCFVLVLKGIYLSNIISLIPIAEIQALYNVYLLQMEHGVAEKLNIFNAFVLSKVLICSFLIYNATLISRFCHDINVWLIIYTSSVAIFILCSNITVLSLRLSELMQISEIMLIPMLLYVFKNRTIGKLVVIGISFMHLLIITFYFGYLL